MDGSTFFVIDNSFEPRTKKMIMDTIERNAIKDGKEQIKMLNEETEDFKLVCKSKDVIFYYSGQYGLVAFLTTIDEITQTASIVVVGVDKHQSFTFGKFLFAEELNNGELSFYKRLSDKFFSSIQ